ncbi:hypothetical protein KC19_4G111700 [Ceratodon purpureus]|uniref:Glutaredoxin-dependent peroxiredoxin n=1 Tax=Ceratodon purpureus TaxID=3225 RepID=A0A8T0I7Y8_CERPU|nr:hypothetical protein KC19_4G111700 [Ceratodon purpureus]
MTAALAMAKTGEPVMTPTMASPVRCDSHSVKNIARGEHFGRSSRAIATQLSHGRVKALQPGLVASGARSACTISEGAKLPEADLCYFDKEGNVHTVKVSELTRAKKVVLFAVPGAFTPTCSTQHVPGFVAKAEELRKAGVDVLACVSVNDAFVMRAWGEQMKVGENVLLLSDGLGKFTKAMGATVDLSDKPVGLGVRSRRYAMVVDDGVVKALNMEEGGAFTHSSAEDILKCLQKHKASNVECSAGQNVM